MKDLIKRVLVVALSVLLLFTATACNDKNGNGAGGYKDTSNYLVKSGKTEYQIVIGSDADQNEEIAAKELQTFFREATGISLDIVTDAQAVSNGKYISVGETSLQRAAGLTANAADIKEQGYKIKTSGSNVYLLGASSVSTIYAVYDFLKYHFNYEFYFTDVYSLDKNVKNLKLLNVNVTEIPDIDKFSAYSSGIAYNNTTTARRFREIAIKDWLIPINGAMLSVHNIFKYLPKETFGSSHPLWYEENQICFTAHGNETEKQEMFSEIVKVVKRGLSESEATIFSISLPDNTGFCSCPDCKDVKSIYGTDSAQLILLCNELSKYFETWFEGEGAPYKRDIKFMFLAYQDVIDAPVTYDEDAKGYVANSPDVICRDNVGVYFAADTMYGTYDFTSAINADIKQKIIAWQSLTDFFTFWLYDVNFNNYLYPYDSMYSKVDWYQFLKECGAVIVNDQSQYQNKNGGVAWCNVKNYVSTKLRWDVNANVDELIKSFFATCYQDEWLAMYSVYLQFKGHTQTLKERVTAGGNVKESDIGGIFGNLESASLWDKPIITGWYETIKGCYDRALEKAKTNPAYVQTAKLIAMEMVSPLYMLVKLYGEELPPTTYEDYLAQFKSACDFAGVMFYMDSSDNGQIEKLYDKLGIL